MIEIFFIIALIILAFKFLTREKYRRRKQSGKKEIDPYLSQPLDPINITRQILGDSAMKKIYKQPRRIVMAKLESKKIAAIKASDSGPLIVINKEHEQSGKLYTYLISKHESADHLLDVICHTDNATNENCNLITQKIAEKLINQEKLS